MSVASLQVTKTYADGSALTEAILDTAFQSIQTYTQQSVVNNFNQLRKDIWGATYSLDNDGNANLTNTFYKDCFGVSWTTNDPRTNSLYNKQTASVMSFVATNLNTTATTAWAEASQAYRLIFTPEKIGKYMISYQLPIRQVCVGTGDLRAVYAIVNKTAGATLFACNVANTKTGTDTQELQTPIHLTYVHNFASTSAATFTVYYKNTVFTATVTTHSIFCNATNKVGVYGHVQKI